MISGRKGSRYDSVVRSIRLDLRQLPSAVQKDVKRLAREEIQQALRATARYAIRAIKDTARKTDPRPLATRAYDRGWYLVEHPGQIRIKNSTKQAYYVEHGRRPGPAPYAPFLEWARAKLGAAQLGAGDVAAKNRVEQLAFLAWRKVMRVGTRPRKVVARTMPRINRRLRREVNRALKK